MQDALPAFVLNSETLPRKPMNEVPSNPTNATAQAVSLRPGLSDARLLGGFLRNSFTATSSPFMASSAVLRTRTGKVKDVLEVEQEIARVRGEIEQMEAEQKTLEHRVEFATIELKLAEEYQAQLSTPAPSVAMQVRNAIINGFRNAFESLLALVLFFAESGPSLLLWLALLGVPAWRLWRRYRRAQSLGSLAGA
jgi:hypothetical protein